MHQNTIVTAVPKIVIHPDDGEPIGISLIDSLPKDAVVSSVTDVTVEPSTELSINNAQPNTVELYEEPNNKGRQVPIGKAVLGVPSGQVTGGEYTITFKCLIAIDHPDYPTTYTRSFVLEVVCHDK